MFDIVVSYQFKQNKVITLKVNSTPSPIERHKLKKMGFRHIYQKEVMLNSIHFELQTEIKDQKGKCPVVRGKTKVNKITERLRTKGGATKSRTAVFKTLFDLMVPQSARIIICAGVLSMTLDCKLDK